MKRFDAWLDVVDALVETAWYWLVWLFRLAVILGVLAGCAYLALEGLPFGEWVRVEIVIGFEPEGLT